MSPWVKISESRFCHWTPVQRASVITCLLVRWTSSIDGAASSRVPVERRGIENRCNIMASNPPQAIRLTFSYQGSQIGLLGAETIAMTVPASSPLAPQPGQTGYWLEVHDAAGRLLYHRPLHNPIAIDVEAFSQTPGASIARVPRAASEGRFNVLIPDTGDARSFTLRGPADPTRSDEPAQELLRIDVDTLRRSKPPPAPPISTGPPRTTG